ncbi:glycoside hydrolase family 3 protein [Amylostereum chailletii]|nr:glycoside hydrolase family 3 protein [Amylostereum chailletii]
MAGYVRSMCFYDSSRSSTRYYPSRANPNLCSLSKRDERTTFIDALLSNLTVPELARQLHLVFADDVVGPNGTNSLYDAYTGPYGIGLIHDWYPSNQTQFNTLQSLNLNNSHTPIPFLQTGECLHGVGSFRQSLFPSPIALAATFDPDMMYRVGRAIGAEARSIGIHACFSPVLDLGKDTRWGRAQEGLGEDFVLTTHMGVAYAQGLSKNSSWSEPDAVIPIMKHFAAHGSPSGGINAGPYTGFGPRQVMSEMLVPFKAVVQAYHDIDGVPCPVNTDLYDALSSWGFDGFPIGDLGTISMLQHVHNVASSPSDALAQWLSAGGAVEYYDYDLPTFEAALVDLVANGTLDLEVLRARVRGVLNAKWDLGLFDAPFIPDGISIEGLVDQHEPLTLEAAARALVLVVNRNNTLPLAPSAQGIAKIALVGPMADTYNFGDYSGVWGAAPIDRATTLRQAVAAYLAANASNVVLSSAWGANTWTYQGQYPIPRDLLRTPNGTAGGLQATYYATTDFEEPVLERVEVPNQQWGLYAPNGLPSVNFSVVWEGTLSVPEGMNAQGWFGVAVGRDSTAVLDVDGQQLVNVTLSSEGNILGDILPFDTNTSTPPPGCAPFDFVGGQTYNVSLAFQAWSTLENRNGINSQVQLVWNLVDRVDAVGSAVEVAKDADVVVFAGGAGWNSDGENGDRATMSLAEDQSMLLDALLALGKPVVMVLEGGRPFAIPEYYAQAAAVLYAYFPGPQGGQAISDALFGMTNPGGRLPLSVPASVGTLPAIYNFKPSAHGVDYRDVPTYPLFSFGFGLSYTSFTRSDFSATPATFTANDTLTFSVTIKNTGERAGSDVPQVYLMQRTSSVVQPARQMVAFARVDLEPGEEKTVEMILDPGMLLLTYTRAKTWEVEKGNYTFALTTSEHDADDSTSVTLTAL